jgi:methionyl aminopeptidase
VIIRKSLREIEAMREAGRVVAFALEAMRASAGVGTSLKELDDIAAEVLAAHAATSAFLGYHPHFAPTPFPGVICASVNDVVVHGPPTEQRLRDGDVLSIDLGVVLNGWVGDAAITFIVGRPRSQDRLLVQHTKDALAAGIAAARQGNRLGDVAHAVGTIGRRHGYGIPTGWGGHGVGRQMHEDPPVPNEGVPGRGLRLEPGLVIAIEPMFMSGGLDTFAVDADGWTVRTSDGSRAAHWEHTIAVTADGPLILTEP